MKPPPRLAVRRLRLGGLALLAVAAWLLPYRLSPYNIHVVDVAILFALLAMGLGLALGVAGQINLAQVAFFGVAAYATAILTTHEGFGFWTAAALALLAALVTGLLTGLPALRMQSHYLGIVTLGLALAFINWITNASIAGGAEGISAIPVPPLLGIDLSSEYLFYYLELIVFAAALAFGLFVVRTPLGRRLRAMRDDPLAAAAVGAEIPYLRITAFALASLYGGAAGVLYAGLIRYVAPETFSIANMFLLLGMVIIGGRQSLVGCVVGAIGLSLVREALVDFAVYAQLAYGIVVVLMVVFAPTGLAGVPARVRGALDRRRGRSTSAAALRPFQPFEPSEAVAGQRHAGDAQGPRPPRAARDARDQDQARAATALLEVRGVTMRFRGVPERRSSTPGSRRHGPQPPHGVEAQRRYLTGVLALDDVSLRVEPGEIRGIVGPNGSGKTTLFNVISGLYRPGRGEVLLDGRPVTGTRPWRLSFRGVARTFQGLRLFGNLTVRENLLVALDRSKTRSIWRYALWPVGVWRHDRELGGHADRLLERFGLAEFADAPPRSLPYGIQRRVELARAMASGPRLLLLDEPAAGLNGEEVRQLAEMVRSIRRSGVTVVLIEHNMGLVMSLCERVTVLSSGAVIAEGTPAEVAATPAVIEAYLGDATIAGVSAPAGSGAAPTAARETAR